MTSRVKAAAMAASTGIAEHTTFRSLTFLGTSSGTPTNYRNVSSYALTHSDGSVWLVDAGEGTQHQLMRCANVSRGSIEKIFVTHLHGDHSFGLPGLLCSTSLTWCAPGVVKQQPPSATSSAAVPSVAAEEDDGATTSVVHDHFSRRCQYLELYGPVGLAAYLRGALLSSESRFPFQYRVTELLPSKSFSKAGDARATSTDSRSLYMNMMQDLRHPDEAEPQFLRPDDDDGSCGAHYTIDIPNTLLKVRAAVLDHRVFCVGYVVTEPDMPGTLLMSKVEALGVPKGPLLAKLKAGHIVSFSKPSSPETMIEVKPEDVLGNPSPGRTVILLGDTCDSTHIATLLRRYGIDQPDWLVHESTFDVKSEALAVPRGHSSTRMAGLFAASIRAKNLILTHFSARYPSAAKDPEVMESLRLEADAAAASGCVDGCNTTIVHVADDFTVFSLERKKSTS